MPSRVELRELKMPEPKEGEAVVKILACGICGTDAEAFRSHQADWHQRGHEAAGKVVAVGKGVTNVKVGDLVSIIGSLPCNECSACQRGELRFCSKPRWFGGDAFVEFLCKPSEFLFPIPDLTPEEGALMEPLTVAIDLLRDGNVRLGSKVLLIGAGPIGLMALRLCREAGVSKLYVSHPSTSKARLQLALEWGADLVLHPDKEDIVERMKELEPEGVDSVLVTIKPSIGIPQAAQVCAVGGTIAFIGMEWKPEANILLDIDRFHFRKISLVGSNHNPCSLLYPQAADLLRRKVIEAERLISHRFPLEAIAEAFHFATQNRGDVIKVMIVNEA
ncbi:MAG: alcohol dehydrogenase catalytic domain-containing protein [Armatimonadetes bacterium]|nr:alcohol dehydrogenase catalytic domain-containing protein [Armatimonadota bacterium]